MIGLCKEDLYLCKKMIIIMISTFLVLLVFGILWRSAYDYGNLASFPPEDLEYGKRSSEKTFPFLIALLLGCESAFFTVNTIEMDIKSKFSMYAYSGPVSDQDKTKVKVYELLTAFVVCSLATVVYGLIFGILYGFSDVGIGILIGIGISVVINCMACISVPLAYKHKNAARAISTPVAVLIGGFYAIGIPEALFGAEDGLGRIISKLVAPITKAGGFKPWLSNNWVWIVPIILIVHVLFLAWAYFATLRQVKRRERICGAS